jgi:hypothetical protein
MMLETQLHFLPTVANPATASGDSGAPPTGDRRATERNEFFGEENGKPDEINSKYLCLFDRIYFGWFFIGRLQQFANSK